MLKQIIVEPQMVSAYMQDRQRIPLTVMSFDINVHELVIPVVGGCNQWFGCRWLLRFASKR